MAFILMLFLTYIYIENGMVWISFMFYLLASTSFIALPHEPILLYFGKQYGILLPLFFSIFPTILGCYVDYLVLGSMFRHRIFSGIRTSHISQKIIRLFRLYPFVTIFLAALSPVPFYPVLTGRFFLVHENCNLTSQNIIDFQ